MKRCCTICGATHDQVPFSKTKVGYYNSYCKACDNARGKFYRQERKPELHILSRLKSRCKQRNLSFDLDEQDIIIPQFCPILGIPLKFNSSLQDDSVSVDRIDPKQGYIRGNIMIMSMRANRIKTDATIEELEKVLHFLKQQENSN